MLPSSGSSRHHNCTTCLGKLALAQPDLLSAVMVRGDSKVRKTPWVSPVHSAEQWSVHPLITNAILMVIAPFLTIMKHALGKKANTCTLLDTGTEHQGVFPLDCMPCHEKEDSDPSDLCKVVTPSSQGSHLHETHVSWMMQSHS